jgi:hypothetical protein
MNLEKAEADLAAQQAIINQRLKALDEHAQQGRELHEIAAAHKAKADAHDARSHAMHQAFAEAQRRLGELQDTMLKQMVIHASGATLRVHAIDSVEHGDITAAAALKIKTAWRGALDTPNSEKYSMHTAVKQAIALAPVIDDLDRPVYELGATVAGLTDWPARRERLIPEIRQLLADLNKLLAKISSPLQAA